MHALLPLALLVSGTLAAPRANTPNGDKPLAGRQTGTCENPLQRKAWHTLSDAEQAAYIEAELCLMEKPASLGLRGTKTRFDELQSCHVLQAEITHNVGAFLPFHRLLMWAHEHLLRTECGYEGAQPYWQEQLDASAFTTSTVLSPSTFGTNGDPSNNNCISDGAFANYTNNLGPGYQINTHCIDRVVSDQASSGSSQAQVDACLEKETWLEAWPCIEGQPHAGGHGGVGGEMVNPISSPGDPVFYLHHTWLDKVWWDWQARDLPGRLTEMGGSNVRDFSAGFPGGGDFEFPGGGSGFELPPGGGFFEERPDDVPEPVIEGDEGGDETLLTHIINMYGVVDSLTIAEIMDIGDLLCYEYVESEE